jgi:hypothetical protein
MPDMPTNDIDDSVQGFYAHGIILGLPYSVEREILVKEGDEQIKNGLLDETLVFVQDITDLNEEGSWVTDAMQEGGFETVFTEDVLKHFYDIVLRMHKDSAGNSLYENASFIGLWTAETSREWESGIQELEYFDFVGIGKVVLDQ